MLDVNPAKLGVENPQRRRTEKRPFESWDEIEAVAGRLGPRLGPMVIFAAATGMRPGEWVALEHRDVDRHERVAYVRRSFSKGRLKCTKTESSVRAVPSSGALLFPAPKGGYLDLHNFRNLAIGVLALSLLTDVLAVVCWPGECALFSRLDRGG
jgi:integrase